MKVFCNSITKKLTVFYGLMILVFLILFVLFDLTLIGHLKDRGIDMWLEQSTKNVFDNIDSLIKKSVRQYIKMENDKLLFEAGVYHDLSKRGIISEDEARMKILDLISSVKVGDSGYSYAVDSKGIMLAHPVEKYRNQDFSWDEGIVNQLKLGNGYIVYQWKNPNDDTKRDKILYMDTFTPWGWLISTTAYADDPTIGDIKAADVGDFITQYRFSEKGHTSLLDGKGNFIIHPRNEPQPPRVNIKELIPHLDVIKENGKGRLIIRDKENDFGLFNREIIYYYFIPTLDWIIITCESERHLYDMIINIYILSGALLIIFIVLFLLFNRSVSKMITSPLNRLIKILDESAEGSLSLRSDIATGDEYEVLGSHFNSFMNTQEKLIAELRFAQYEVGLLAKFADENPDPVIRITDDAVLDYANNKAKQLILTKLALDQGDKVPDDIMEGLTSHEPLTHRNEYEIDGQIYSFSISRIDDPAGIYLYGRDITRQKKYESLLLLSENIFRNSIEGIAITDKDGNIESVNPAFTKVTGYTEEEALKKNPRVLKSHLHNQNFYKDMWNQLIEKGYWDGEIWNRRKNGDVFPEYLTISSIRNKEGEISQYIAFFHDLSAEKEKEEKIKYESTHDQLTRLPNREYLNKAITEQIKKVANSDHGFSLLYIDIDNFKRINESLGTEAGDILLKECARRLNELLGAPDVVARMGSDEFAVLVSDRRDDISIQAVIEDVLRIFKPVFLIKGRELYIHISMGISIFPDDDFNPLELIAKAEMAMRTSKLDVNKIFHFFTPVMHKIGINRVDLESALKQAFENRQFYLNYQPKVDVQTGFITGAEALVRMFPINGEIVGPDVFIPVAEEIGLIEHLGAWVIEKACLDTKYLQEKGYAEIDVAVNLSPWQFRNKDLPEQINNIIISTGLAAPFLNLEITEGMAINNIEESIAMMNKLTSLGFTLAIDDFGTGYSSLSFLSDFSVNLLKIDKSFVNGIPHDLKKTGIALAVLALAQNLGMKTVAEGVETKAHYEFMREHGCSYIQGYYFYKPMGLDDYEKVLRKNYGKDNPDFVFTPSMY